MTTMTDDEKRLLANAVSVESWYVTASSLLTVADMVRKGWVEAYDTHEGTWFRPTEEGVKVALAFGIIQ